MNDALEQMAKAAAINSGLNWDYLTETMRDVWRSDTHAAIAAIPEDDDVLCDAVRDAIHYWITDQTCKRIIAALKAALLESGDGR